MPAHSRIKQLPSSKQKKSLKLNLIFFFMCLWFLSIDLSIAQDTIADFTFNITKSPGCTPVLVEFELDPITQTYTEFDWIFGDGNTATNDPNPDHNYTSGSNYLVSMIAKIPGKPEHDTTVQKFVSIIQTPFLDFSSDRSEYCPNEQIELTWSGISDFDSLTWDLDGDTVITYTEASAPNPIHYTFTTQGTKNIMLTTYNGGCDSTAMHSVDIIGPLADFTQSKTDACVGDSIRFELGTTSGVDNFTWYPEGRPSLVSASDIDPYTHTYTSYSSEIIPELEVSGGGATCYIKGDTIVVYRMEAVINYQDLSEYCHNRNVYFRGSDSRFFSGDQISYSWEFGDGTSSNQANPSKAYTSGEYYPELTISNPFGCSDTETDTILINKLPVIEVFGDTTICPGESAALIATGGTHIFWTPTDYLDDFTSYSPVSTPDTTITYSPVVSDSATGCSSIPGAAIVTIEVADVSDLTISIAPADTSIVIGGIVSVRADSSGEFDYLWSPDQYISCTSCARPIMRPLDAGENIYTLLLTDQFDCSSEEYTVRIEVREEYIIGVPEAFTPNGDGTNDVIYVNGLGVKDLLEFRVYNRWGNEVFFSDDLEIGWDGTTDGKEQPIDSYTYFIKAEMFDNGVAEKRGSFTLIR